MLKNDMLIKENTLLRNDNERMKRILNNNSDNSPLPPSSDKIGKPANFFNGRKPSDNSKGGQPGHKSNNLTKELVEECIRKGELKHRIEEIGTKCEKYVVRYRLDLDIQAVAIEIRIYQDENGKYPIPEHLKAEVTYGECVKAVIAHLYSEGVVSNERICEFVNSISGGGLSLSEGTVYNVCRKLSNLCKDVMPVIEQDLLNSEVVCTDATVISVNGDNEYIRNFSNERSVRYVAATNKTLKKMREMPILRKFTGILEHDHETALYHFGTQHGECNVHLCRYLKKNTEETGNTWSEKLSNFLNGINSERNKEISKGETMFSDERIKRYESRFDEIIMLGEEQSKATKGKYAREEEGKLLRRLRKYKNNHLLFVHNFNVPYSNNMSERDLRKCKNRQKMSGGFRKESGMEMYCNILSFVETVKRRGMNIYNSIVSMFKGIPVVQ